MKQILLTCLLFASLSHAAALRNAEFTRVVNDVKKRPESAPVAPAVVGDRIDGKTAVSTGTSSRAELKFADGTITRLGANSVFSLDQANRTVDLQQGTILLQVPKQLGGARVRTAAVTAAVTGTTILIEYQPDGYVKVIVLEGSLDLYKNDKPSEFRSILAGDMVLMKPDGQTIPEPVQVDLKRLKKTSKLVNNEEFEELSNEKELDGADQDQEKLKKKGTLQQSAFIIPGQGTQVTLTNDARQQLTRLFSAAPSRDISTPPAGNRTGTTSNPGQDVAVAQPTIRDSVIIDGQSHIRTNPRLTAFFTNHTTTGNYDTKEGRVYQQQLDGNIGPYLFATPTTIGAEDSLVVTSVDRLMRRLGDWAGFKVGGTMTILQAPTVDSRSGTRNLLLASEGALTLTPYDPVSGQSGSGYWNLGSGSVSGPQGIVVLPALDSLMLASADGIYWNPGFRLVGATQDVILYTQTSAAGPGRHNPDILIDNSQGLYQTAARAVDIPFGTFTAVSAGDFVLTADGQTSDSIRAKIVDVSASGNVTIEKDARITASERITISAGVNLNITDSSSLRRLAQLDALSIYLEAVGGDLNIGGSGGSVTLEGREIALQSTNGHMSLLSANISADMLKAVTLAPNGTITIGNSILTGNQSLSLYAEGSNGRVQFVANSTLNGPAAIAGKTVQIDPGVSVTLNQPNDLRVYSDNHFYNQGTYGNFKDTGGTNLTFNPGDTRQGNFASRHGSP